MTIKWETGTIVTLLVIAAGIIGSYCVAQYQIAEAREDIKTLQSQQSDMKRDRQADRELIVEMQTDVKWIRKTLER